MPFVPLLLAVLIGYPLAAVGTHGLHFAIWPEGVDTPSHWYLQTVRTFGAHPISTYSDMALNQSTSFVGGGRMELFWCFVPAMILSLLLTSGKPPGPRRALTPVYGDAQFATARERRRMRIGLELGIDPDSGRTIRIAVKGNLTTIAPPGSGKSSGLLFPNLAAPEASAWFGPAFVVDPKGDSYRAVGDRRRNLGRSVHCLDPMGLVGGRDHWNPLANLNPDNIIYLQRTAEALLPARGANETHYFREAANSIIVAAFLAAHREGRATPRRIAELLADQSAFAKALDGLNAVSAKSTLSLLQNPPKNIMDLFSTAQQGFRWCEDPRLAALTADSSFELASICEGDADLFLTLPTEDIRRLSPLIWWLLTDLFATIRRQKPRERIVVFIDEAKALGPFQEILTGYGELPGYNTSLWTFWQNRPQIVEVYGENGARDI